MPRWQRSRSYHCCYPSTPWRTCRNVRNRSSRTCLRVERERVCVNQRCEYIYSRTKVIRTRRSKRVQKMKRVIQRSFQLGEGRRLGITSHLTGVDHVSNEHFRCSCLSRTTHTIHQNSLVKHILGIPDTIQRHVRDEIRMRRKILWGLTGKKSIVRYLYFFELSCQSTA